MKSKKKKEDQYALALDIGTEFVKALILEVSEDRTKGRIVGVGRSRQGLTDMHGGSVTDIGAVVANSEKAIEEAEEMAKISPEQAVVGIAGELVKGSTLTVTYERMKPKKEIKLAELKNIIHEVQWRAFDGVRKQLYDETGSEEVDIKLINAAVVDVKIDGYKVTNPLNFQGKNVKIGVFNAYAPLLHFHALESIASDLGLDLLSISAEPYAVARVLESSTDSNLSAIFIDVGGGTTDIAVVQDGGLVGTKMFAIGGRVFTKRIAKALSLDFAEAEKVKIRYAKGLLSPKEMTTVRQALLNDSRVWLSGVELALKEFNVELLPTKILICGGGSELPEVKTGLLSDSWTKGLPFASRPQVKFVMPSDIKNISDETGLLKNTQYITPLGLANLALDLAGEEGFLTSLLKRAI